MTDLPGSSPEPVVPRALQGTGASYTASLSDGSTSSAWSWTLGPVELRRQVQEYDQLPVTQSYRGIASLLTVFSGAITIVAALAGWVAPNALWGLIIYFPLAWFIYRGHRWAILAMMALWTFEKGYQVWVRFPAGIGAILFWIIFMKYYLGAFGVERARRERSAT